MSDEPKSVEAFYDEHGEQLGLTTDYQHLKPVLPPISEKRILDVGCGLGNGAAYLDSRGASVIGIDISQEEISTAQQRHGDTIEFYQDDLRQRLSRFDDGDFDVIVCALTLAHIENWKRPFGEFHRVLADAGVLVIHAHHPFVDYLELQHDQSYHVIGDGATYTETEQFVRPWGPAGEGLRFYRRPLGKLFQPALDAGFVLEKFVEPGTGSHDSDRYDPSRPPRHILLRFRR